MGPFINKLYEDCWKENQKLHKKIAELETSRNSFKEMVKRYKTKNESMGIGIRNLELLNREKIEELEEYIEAVETDREYYKNGSGLKQAEFTIEVLKKDIEGLKERLNERSSIKEDYQLEEIERLNGTIRHQREEMERMVDRGNEVIEGLEEERDKLLGAIHGNRVDTEKLEALELENKDLYDAVDDLEDMNKILLIHLRRIEGEGK